MEVRTKTADSDPYGTLSDDREHNTDTRAKIIREDTPTLLISVAQPKAGAHKRCRMRVFLTAATGFSNELRVQLPIKFELVINLKTANAPGLMARLALRAPTRRPRDGLR